MVLKELGFNTQEPMLYCDNKVLINIACTTIQYDRTKHVEIYGHFFKEKLDDAIIYTKLEPIKKNLYLICENRKATSKYLNSR